MGPTPMITVYVDEYPDRNCQVMRNSTVGTAAALFVIPAATNRFAFVLFVVLFLYIFSFSLLIFFPTLLFLPVFVCQELPTH